MTYDIWTYQVDVVPAGEQQEFTGFGVEAMDGSIGKIDEATYEVGSSYLVVDTGPWIFGKKVMLPAGVIDRIDLDEEIVYVNRTRSGSPLSSRRRDTRTTRIGPSWATTTTPGSSRPGRGSQGW